VSGLGQSAVVECLLVLPHPQFGEAHQGHNFAWQVYHALDHTNVSFKFFVRAASDDLAVMGKSLEDVAFTSCNL